MARPKVPQRKPVAARVGNYMAEVDTTGMDPAMKATMQFTEPKKKQKPWWEAVTPFFKGGK